MPDISTVLEWAKFVLAIWSEVAPGVPCGLALGASITIFLFLRYPHSFEIAASFGYKVLIRCGKFFQKQYITHDLQGRIGKFVDDLRREVPELETKKIKVEWVDKPTSRQAFLEDGVAVLRLRKEDPQDTNFVYGTYLFVSTSLLTKAKRYLSESQRSTVDIFVTQRLIEEEKSSVKGIFLDEFLHKVTSDPKSKTSIYIDKYAKIDYAGLFFPLFLQELFFLGNKVFGRRRDDLIISEVNQLIDYLEAVSNRESGDDSVPLDFRQTYCRCSIVIVGKAFKLRTESTRPWIRHLRKVASSEKYETVYLLGNFINRREMDQIALAVRDIYETIDARKIEQRIRIRDRGVDSQVSYSIILRLIGTPVIQASSETN